jgi:predicted nucleotidyltransferase
MDKNEALKITKEFALLIKDILNPSKVFLYGSYANNQYHENSDIDIAVIVNKLDGNYLTNLSLLYKLRKQINLSIEPVLFIEGKDPSGFLEYIEKTGELAYSI